VQVGADADIVVFNPDTVTDNSTYEPGMGALPSTPRDGCRLPPLTQ